MQSDKVWLGRSGQTDGIDANRLIHKTVVGSAWKHVAHARGLVWLRQDYAVGLIQGGVHTELEVDGTRGWTDHLPWSHVEGGAGLRGYGVRIQGIKAYSARGKSE